VGTNPPVGEAEHPVVNITYEDAEAYALWKGKRLPTREQWMRAFRGDEDSLFPWGDTYDATRGNVADNAVIRERNTVPVDATPRDVTELKVYNMFGNACEFIRGSFAHKGRQWRMSKGGEFKMLGMTFGIGSSQFFYGYPVVDPGLGFRCVIEEE
jgi:formylglycine-generating enzyme required for sulfatase activity